MFDWIVQGAWQHALDQFAAWLMLTFWLYCVYALVLNAACSMIAFYVSPFRPVAGVVLLLSIAFLTGYWMGNEDAYCREPAPVEHEEPAPPFFEPFRLPF